MANEFGTGLETVGKDVLKVVEAPVKFIDKAAQVIETIVKDDPAAKVILTTLVSKAEGIGADGAKDIVEKGLNPVDDLATLAAIKDLLTFVESTVIPFIEQAYGTFKTDLSAS